MVRRLFILLLLTACLCLRSTPAATQQPTTVDPALAGQFVAADAAAREALIAAHPEILESTFTAWLNSEGQRLRNAADYEGSERHHRAALYVGEQHARPAAVVSSTNALCSLALAQNKTGAARQFAADALAIADKNNDLAGQQQSWGNLAVVQRRVGELDDALVSIGHAIDLAKRLNDALLTGRAMHTAGVIQNDTGESAKALDILLQAIKFKTEGDAPPSDFLTTYTVIGAIYSEQGALDVAMDYYRRGIDGMKGEVNATVAGVYNNIGLIQRARKQYAEARKTYAQALPIARQARNEALEATMLYNLAQIEINEDQPEKAEALIRESLALRERAGPRRGVVESLDALASLLSERGHPDEAVGLAERAVHMATESRMLDNLWRSHVSAGMAYSGLRRDSEARAAFERAIETIETLRTLAPLGNGDPRATFEKLTPYYELAELSVRVGRPFDALAAVDRARAHALVEILATKESASRQLAPAEREREQNMTTAILDATEQLEKARAATPSDRAQITQREAALASARVARDAYISNLFAQRPDLRLATGRMRDITIAQLASVLAPGTAIVSFVLEDHESWVYVATLGLSGPVVTAHALPKGNDRLMATTAKFIEQVASRDLAFAASARAAYDLLLGPAEARLAGITRLIIIPDGPLWRLPFQALKTPRGSFVIEERAVSYTPSIAALVALEERRRSRPAAAPFLVALGDPRLPRVVAPPPVGSSTARGDVFTRLPEAGREVQSLRSLYGAARSTVLTDSAASEAALRERVSRATILHVATHGVLDNDSPMYSYLLMAPGSGAAANPNDDGRLEAWEVMEMGVTADIAVLSACQTAGSGPAFGEGLMGLSWSLFASGASTAVVSQWAVDSASTTTLMLAFHKQLLARGLHTSASADALRGASLSVLKTSAYRHPFYWAGFVSIGAR